MSKLKPFDLLRALRGDKLITRDGREAEIVQIYKKDLGQYQLLIEVGEAWEKYTLNGKYNLLEENKCDLFMAPEEPKTKKLWIVIYKDLYNSGYGPHHPTSCAYENKEDLKKVCSEELSNVSSFIQIEIPDEE